MNTWKVYWWEDGRKKFKRFDGPKPTLAVERAKELKREGKEVAVVSSSKAFSIPPSKVYDREPGMLWCPYCVAFRRFKIYALKREHYVAEAKLRCPVCSISTDDYYVKKHNQDTKATWEILSRENQRREKQKEKPSE